MRRNFFDQVSDRGLVKLSEIFQPFIGGMNRADPEFVEDYVMPALASSLGDNFHVVFNPPPSFQTAVVQTPMGPAVVRFMRHAHGEYVKNYIPRSYEGIPEEGMENEIRNRMFKDGAAFALPDEKLFPVGNPQEAVLSLLYALGQREALGPRYDNRIRPQVIDAVGTSVVQEIETFVKALENGMKEFVDPQTNKKVTVTIEDFCKDSDRKSIV